MRKILQVRDFSKDGGLPNEQIIAYRRKTKLYVQNFDTLPAERFVIRHLPDSGKVVIEITLNEHECLTIGDMQGIAIKREIEG